MTTAMFGIQYHLQKQEYIKQVMRKNLFVPDKFYQLLPELKQKTFKWRDTYTSNSDAKTTVHIEYYAANTQTNNNLVLLPGIASNTNIEPLMQALTFWGLTHKYNIYCLYTFLANFQPTVSLDAAKKNTVQEFISVTAQALDLIHSQYLPATTPAQHTCVIGHSAGATSVFEVLNKNVRENKPTTFSSAITFAPYMDASNTSLVHKMCQSRHKIPTNEYYAQSIGIFSPHDIWESGTVQYISLLPSFVEDYAALAPQPELMAKYTIPITIVAGGKDRKAPIAKLRQTYEMASKLPNGHLFKFVEFKNCQHSFMPQRMDYPAIIKLIKSQRNTR